MSAVRRLLLALALLPAVTVAADTLLVKRLVVNAGTAAEPITVNSYLVCHLPSRGAVLIDPGADDGRFTALAEELGVQVRLVLNTHGHFDHVGGNDACCERFAARLAVPAADRPLYEKNNGADQVDIWLRDGQVLDLEGFSVQVLATPGHTPGSSCFLIAGQLFSGDTLLANGVGRVPDGGNEEKALRALAKVIRKKLLVLPAATPVWPGHGRPTTIGAEALLNPFLN